MCWTPTWRANCAETDRDPVTTHHWWASAEITARNTGHPPPPHAVAAGARIFPGRDELARPQKPEHLIQLLVYAPELFVVAVEPSVYAVEPLGYAVEPLVCTTKPFVYPVQSLTVLAQGSDEDPELLAAGFLEAS